MPVTKKKGAIFAIYADTPPRSTASAPAKQRTNPSPSRSSAAAPRRALAAKQPSAPASSALKPKALGVLGEKSVKVGVLGAKSLKPKSVDAPLKPQPISSKPLGRKPVSQPLRSSTSALSEAAPRRALGSVPSKPLRTGSAGRTFQVFTDEPAPSAPVPTVKASTKLQVAEDKENASAPDSPASRTRSKTALAPSSKGLKQPLLAKQPLKAKSRTVGVRVLMDASDAYGAHGEEPAGFRDVFV